MLFFYLPLLFAACEKCEIIREANKHLPPPKYEYYDDYLKALKEEEDDESDEKFELMDSDEPS